MYVIFSVNVIFLPELDPLQVNRQNPNTYGREKFTEASVTYTVSQLIIQSFVFANFHN